MPQFRTLLQNDEKNINSKKKRAGLRLFCKNTARPPRRRGSFSDTLSRPRERGRAKAMPRIPFRPLADSRKTKCLAF